MAEKLNLKFWHGAVLMGIVAVLFYLNGCSKDRVIESQGAMITNYEDTVMQYKADNGDLVDYNKALQVEREAFMQHIGDSIKRYLDNINIPKPDVVVLTNETVYIDSIPSVSLAGNDCKYDTTFVIGEEWYTIKGRLTQDLLQLNSITIPNESSIVIGDRKEKWWKKREYIVTVNNTNPYISTNGIQSYTLQEQRSRFTIGPSLGYGFYYDPWKGNVGHGIYGGLSLNWKLFGWKKHK